ncbi:glycosyltransferase family 2 protein [Foetidibacter luteolus]|uniref:glycosyltransferase family 2 protein n=1 Tax=Foetidibacter luteolus TaxID=2608880 RepID=UPI00129BCD8A|nr:glycosyltransferase family 2 protein [Foetidibacter luteolus]
MNFLSQPSVAIVILNYNGINYLRQFLPSVLNCGYGNKRVIVADNASTDGSLELLQNEFTTVERILLPRNYGFAGGYNMALQQVQADYFILLNSDVEVTPGWIEPVIALMETDPLIAACQPKLLSYHQKELFEYSGGAGGWIDYLGYPFSRGRIFEVCEADKGQYNNPEAVFWASGAAMFVRPAVFNACNGFDGWFFAHMEEIDLCWRMQLLGYKIMSCPASTVYHVGGGTLPKGNERKVYLNFRNNLVMLSKNLTVQERLWKLPFRFLLDVLFALKNLFTGYPKSFTAVLKAYVSLVLWWLRRKKKYPYRRMGMKALTGVHQHSVVWAYFAGKKTLFSEIVGKKR